MLSQLAQLCSVCLREKRMRVTATQGNVIDCRRREPERSENGRSTRRGRVRTKCTSILISIDTLRPSSQRRQLVSDARQAACQQGKAGAAHHDTMGMQTETRTPITYPTSFCIFGLCFAEREQMPPNGAHNHAMRAD